MSEAVVDDIVAVLPPLLQSLEALGFIARHLNPPDFDRVMEAAGQPDQALEAVRPRLIYALLDAPEVTRSELGVSREAAVAAASEAAARFASLLRVASVSNARVAAEDAFSTACIARDRKSVV